MFLDGLVGLRMDPESEGLDPFGPGPFEDVVCDDFGNLVIELELGVWIISLVPVSRIFNLLAMCLKGLKVTDLNFFSVIENIINSGQGSH